MSLKFVSAGNYFLGQMFLLVVICSTITICKSWNDNVTPKIRISKLNDGDVQKFSGNTSHPDHFKLLEQDGDVLLVGSRNIVYNISLSNLEENKRLEWYSSEDDVRMCRLKGKSEDSCQNYIRVLAMKSKDVLLVCGTNSFKPRCREYLQTRNDFEVSKEQSGEGLCPYDPNHNSTAVFAGNVKDRSEDNLYVATTAQFSGADPLIYRSPLRTEQFNPKHLNAPNFVHSFHHEDHVYFFFRENAVEFMNCGKNIFSRVARVCTRDRGGPHKFSKHWTSFSKTRLNCSIPGDFPFYFNEIQSSTNLIKGVYNGKSNDIVYGIFTTQSNSPISSSAICAFRMEDIYKSFAGSFKSQEDTNSNWLAIPSSKVPEPRPGACSNDSSSLPEATLNFIKDHPLMNDAVPSMYGQPILVESSFKFKMNQITVDPQIETVSGKMFDVLFIGTTDGRVLKVINAGSNNHKTSHTASNNAVAPVIIEDIQVFGPNVPITNLLVYHTFYEAKLLVVSSNDIQAIPLHKCTSRASSCSKCVHLQDPYCAWDIQRGICTSSRSRFWNRENFIQNIEDGFDSRCGGNTPVEIVESNNDLDSLTSSSNGNAQSINENESVLGSNPTIKSGEQMYSLDTLIFAVVTSVVTSLVIGFILGFIFSKRCSKSDPNLMMMYNSYDDPTGYLERTIHHPNHHLTIHGSQIPSDVYSMGLSHGYQSSVNGPLVNTGTLSNKNNPAAINLVLNVPNNSNKNGKNANSSADNKPIQKVKKIYL